jgi:phosphatidylinositol glycan class O
MTGGLPAFVEIGANFNSATVAEDSLMHQWHSSGKRVVMLGDDTWVKLFPSSFFTDAFPFDSFNTRDLDTVDDGVLQMMMPLLRGDNFTNRSEWDIFIAHFLGVDHIGHTHHAHHPAMGERLKRMDIALEEVITHLQHESDLAKAETEGEEDDEGETLILMLGDHGMTDAGEHGEGLIQVLKYSLLRLMYLVLI